MPTKFSKTDVVTSAVNTLHHIRISEVQVERVTAIEQLRALLKSLDSIEIEAAAQATLAKLKAKLSGMGANTEAEVVDGVMSLIFTEGDPSPWYMNDPEHEPDSPPNPDTPQVTAANNACLAEEIKCDLNHGEMPTTLISRQEITILYVTKRNKPDPGHNLPISWHQPISGRAFIEIVGVQMGGAEVPMETRVIFKGVRSKVRGFRTGLSGTVHGLCIDAIDTDDGRFNAWDLYTDVPTKKGEQEGIAAPPKKTP